MIELKPGRYHERVKIPQDRPRVTLLRSNAATTSIEFSVGAKDVGCTFVSSVVEVYGTEFPAKNISLENTFTAPWVSTSGPGGWDNWNDNAANEKTAWYAELGSTDPVGESAGRVPWVHRLMQSQATAFYPQVFLRGANFWDPSKICF